MHVLAGKKLPLWTIAVCLCTLSVGCGDSDVPPAEDPGSSDVTVGNDALSPPPQDGVSPSDTAGPGPVDGTTYHEHVRPIIEQRCVGCHSEGGIAPFTLEAWPQVKALASAIVAATESGAMPPWGMDADCRETKYSRALTADELSAISAWRDDGFLEGDEANYVAPAPPDLPDPGPADLVIAPSAPYTANEAFSDDYHCLVLDHDFTEDTYVTATDVYPGADAIVHHVLIYAVPPNATDTLLAKVSAEPQHDGYTCFGGPDVPTDGLIAAWVPGMPTNVYPEGAALTITAGSKLVMQVHYNLLGSADVPPDLTELALWSLAPGESPSHDLLLTPLTVKPLNIPKDESGIVAEKVHNIPKAATVIGAAPHMHTLGTEISATVLHTDGSETCLASIPDWDFNWQQIYFYEPTSFVDLTNSDQIRIRCEYDNTAANQAYVDGEQVEPRDVNWGEGTLDEMCMTYFVLMRER